MKPSRVLAVAAAFCALGLGGAARADSIHLYSFDPADAETVKAAGPLTFTVRRSLFRSTLLDLRSTTAPATAYLKRVDPRVLGPGRMVGASGLSAGERALYEVDPRAEGAALIAAFCPGASRAWIAAGPLRFDRPFSLLVIGAAGAGAPRLCRTLAFNFHGEWRAPPAVPRIDPRDLERGRYP